MRSAVLAILCAGVLGASAILSKQDADEAVQIRIQLVDANNGKALPGVLRVFPSEGKKSLKLEGLVNRLQGLKQTDSLQGWHAIPVEGVTVTLPRKKLRLEALSGLESELTQQSLDLKEQAPKAIKVKLNAIFQPEEKRLVAGNTHLHLRNMTLPEADTYLKAIPAADRLKVLFISYLERNKDDKHYITNRYPIGDLKKFQSGVLINNGEEHRHNFKGFGQGYGHVMFLNIQKLVKPVSLGPGITGKGLDDLQLAPGIANARDQGGNVIWCHNTFGYEDIPHALAGRLDAVNVFDGSRRDSYSDTWYHYLNIGLRLPISTGTDWFMYDFSRVYAELKPGEKLTIKSWLNALKAGRNQVTNGPLLSLDVAGKSPGATIDVKKPRKVTIKAKALGRQPFGKLQIVHNGKVIADGPAKKQGGHFECSIEKKVTIAEPGWLAARIESTNRNELEQVLFAHTSPVYLEVEGKKVLDLDSAQTLLKQLDEARAGIPAGGSFSSDDARRKVLSLYEEAIKDLQQRINKRK